MGHIGRPLTERLVGQGHHVVVVSSRADRAAEIAALGAQTAIGDMADTDFLAATFAGADIVYVMETLPQGAFFDHHLDVVATITAIGRSYQQALLRAGVKRVVHLSSIGAHTPEGVGMLRFHYNVEQLLLALPEDVAIKFMRPVGFYYNMYAFIPAIQHQGAIYSNYGGDEKEPWVDPLDIAEVIAEEMALPFAGRSVRYIASDEVSPNEVARVLGAAIGKPDLPWIVVPDAQFIAALVAAGMNPQTAEGMAAMNAARVDGTMYADYQRHRPVLGRVKLGDFAQAFAAAYHAGSPAAH